MCSGPLAISKVSSKVALHRVHYSSPLRQWLHKILWQGPPVTDKEPTGGLVIHGKMQFL